MKPNGLLSAAALLLLAFAISQLPNAPAQDMGSAQLSNNSSEPKSGEIEAFLSKALKAIYPDAAVSSFEKGESAGTNAIYKVRFTADGTNMLADITGNGILLKTDEPGNIREFPEAARAAVRKAITGMGIKDNGVRLSRTYAETQKDPSGAFLVVELPSPRTTYGANVQNNHGQPGRFEFNADGTLVERPPWSK
jgi:hypothetical protein